MVSYRQNFSDVPALSFHKGSGQGVVRLSGKDAYCGRFGTPECQANYHRTIGEWLANGRRLPQPYGQRRGDRLNAARPAPPKPSMPRQRKRAVSRPSPCPRIFRNRNLRPRVVTQQKFFSPLPLCDRPGCYEPPVTSPRNPARYCCAACRQAVRNVLDRERKWLSRGTSDGRTKRAIEYQAARRNRALRQRTAAVDMPPRAPPQ